MTLDTAVLADLAAIRAALHEAGVCLNWSPGYSYFGDDGKVHDDHGPVEHTEGERVLAALHDAGYGVVLLAEVESLRAVRDAAAALLEADAAPGPEGADLSTNEVERAWIAWDVRRSAAVRALRAALVSEEGSRPVTERQVSVGGDNE